MERETEKKVMNLERKPLDELRKMWKKVYGEEAPRYSKKYLIPRLAYRMQEKAYGGIRSGVWFKKQQLAGFEKGLVPFVSKSDTTKLSAQEIYSLALTV